MAHYKITVERYDADSEGKLAFTSAVEIECHTNYTLLDDVPEWVQEEIDPDAIIQTSLPEEGTSENPIRLSDG